jgi:thymidine kinase
MAQLYFYYSAMNAGKSTTLLQSAHNYREQGMDVLLYTASIDTRFGSGLIKSRIGLAEAAEVYDGDTQFFQSVSDQLKQRAESDKRIACILVDEAQFLTRTQVDELAEVVDSLSLPVLCFGLRTDFQGETFPGSARLLAVADKLNELKAVCDCGRKATMTIRLDEHGNAIAAGSQVEIGGNERYVSKCRQHHRELLKAVADG